MSSPADREPEGDREPGRDREPEDAQKPEGDRARLFVALELPPGIRALLSGWTGAGPGGLEGLRPVAPDSLHATLCFIGERSLTDVERIVRACRVVETSPAVELQLDAVLWLPSRRPRVLAVGLAECSGTLAALRAALVERLAEAGLVRPDRRAFLAHVTVARVRSRGPELRAAIRAPDPVRFTADSVTLFRSLPGSAPGRYEALATVRLSGCAGSTPTVAPQRRGVDADGRSAAARGRAERPVRGPVRDRVQD